MCLGGLVALKAKIKLCVNSMLCYWKVDDVILITKAIPGARRDPLHNQVSGGLIESLDQLLGIKCLTQERSKQWVASRHDLLRGHEKPFLLVKSSLFFVSHWLCFIHFFISPLTWVHRTFRLCPI